MTDENADTKPEISEMVNRTLSELQEDCYEIAEAHGFHKEDSGTVERQLSRLMLITTEVAEAAEAVRKTDEDENNLGEELADILIRILDFSEEMDIDLDYQVAVKMVTNRKRPHMHGKTA